MSAGVSAGVSGVLLSRSPTNEIALKSDVNLEGASPPLRREKQRAADDVDGAVEGLDRVGKRQEMQVRIGDEDEEEALPEDGSDGLWQD